MGNLTPELRRYVRQTLDGNAIVIRELERVGPYVDETVEQLRLEALASFREAQRLGKKLLRE